MHSQHMDEGYTASGIQTRCRTGCACSLQRCGDSHTESMLRTATQRRAAHQVVELGAAEEGAEELGAVSQVDVAYAVRAVLVVPLPQLRIAQHLADRIQRRRGSQQIKSCYRTCESGEVWTVRCLGTYSEPVRTEGVSQQSLGCFVLLPLSHGSTSCAQLASLNPCQ